MKYRYFQFIIIINVYALTSFKTRVAKTNRLKGDGSTIKAGAFNIPLSIIDGPRRQKISKGFKDLNDTINQMTQVTFLGHSTKQEQNTHFYFSNAHGLFTIKHVSINMKKLKSHRIYSLT